MNFGNIYFTEHPKYYKTVCSKCGNEIEKTNKSKILKFVCHSCKQIRNRERANIRAKLLSTMEKITQE